MRGRLLALDFDGVIWDSAGECFEIAMRTWEALHGQRPPVDEGDFRRARWLVRVGGEFEAVLAGLSEGRDLGSGTGEQFARLAADRVGQGLRFEREFYAQRRRARELDRAAWLALQRPYPEVLGELPALTRAFREVVICTTKDEASVRELLATVPLELPILGKEFSLDKRDQMNHLASARGVPLEGIVFVDDLLHNLEPVASLGVRVALAGWGYNPPSERRRAQALGIPVLQPGDLVRDLGLLASPS